MILWLPILYLSPRRSNYRLTFIPATLNLVSGRALRVALLLLANAPSEQSAGALVFQRSCSSMRLQLASIPANKLRISSIS